MKARALVLRALGPGLGTGDWGLGAWDVRQSE